MSSSSLRSPEQVGDPFATSTIAPVDCHDEPTVRPEFSAAGVGAIAHLYRGEVYRSTIWRTRLDTTTNWAVVTLGVALSISFASTDASPLPLLIVGVLVSFFLTTEARRYRYFNVWRARARWLEVHFYAPLLKDDLPPSCKDWRATLTEDYLHPDYHVGYLTALGRRLRRNYLAILSIQTVCLLGKLASHPFAAKSVSELVNRASIGVLPGWAILGSWMVCLIFWILIAVYSLKADRNRFRAATSGTTMG